MEFIILAYDGSDDAAEARRLKVRPDHARRIKACKKTGEFVSGGAIKDETGKMIGSALFMRFESCADLEQWLADDPYTKANVWQNVQVQNIGLVPD